MPQTRQMSELVGPKDMIRNAVNALANVVGMLLGVNHDDRTKLWWKRASAKVTLRPPAEHNAFDDLDMEIRASSHIGMHAMHVLNVKIEHLLIRR